MTPLPHEALLTTLAEMSIAVVGFSMVVGILRSQSSPDDEARLFTIRDVAEIGLIAAIMSAFPLVVHAYGASADSTWRLSSGIQGAWQIAGIATTFRRNGFPVLLEVWRRYYLMFALISGLIFLNFALVAMNVAIPSSLSGARYVSCMLLLLAQAGFMFLLALFDFGGPKAAA